MEEIKFDYSEVPVLQPTPPPSSTATKNASTGSGITFPHKAHRSETLLSLR